MQIENCSNQGMLARVVMGESRHVAKPFIKYLIHFPWYAAVHIRIGRQPSPNICRCQCITLSKELIQSM